MKNKLIRNSILTLILVLSLPTFAFAATKGTQINKESDGVKATLSFESEKLVPGTNEFTISLFDKDGNPISDANLEVTADMDRSDMGNDGMENDKPMMVDLKEGAQKGLYVGQVDLTKEGKWIVSTTFNYDNQKKNIDFNFNVDGKGPNMVLIGGFAGVIVLIIVIAAINKKNKNKA